MIKIAYYFILLFTLSCSSTKYNSTPQKAFSYTKAPTINSASYKVIEDSLRVGQDTIIYPALILKNKNQESLLNDYIRKEVYALYLEFVIKQKRCLVNALKKPPHEEAQLTDLCQKFLAKSSFSTPYTSSDYISFIVYYSETLDDGKKTFSELFLNFDLKEEKILQLQDLFLPSSPFLASLTSLARKQSRNLSTIITNTTPFSLSQEALVLKTAENSTQKIAWKDIAHLLNKNTLNALKIQFPNT